MRNEKVKKIMPFIIFGLGILATSTIFLPGLYHDGTYYSGIEIAFGTAIAPGDNFLDDSRIAPNSYALAAYFSPFVAGVVTLALRNGNLFSLAMLVVAAVLFFLLPDYIDVIGLEETDPAEIDWDHSYGIILAAIVCVIAALAEMLHITMTEKRG